MRSTTLQRVWRTCGKERAGWSVTRVYRSPQRKVGTSAPSSSARSEPPPHLFENPALRKQDDRALLEAVLSFQAVTWANDTIDALDNPRDGRGVFFDFSTSTCTLCGSTLSGSYALHRGSVDHAARLAVVKRALGLFHTFYSQVQSADPTLPSHASSSSRRSGSVGGTGGSASRSAAAHSRYHKNYSKSFFFDEAAVPSHELLHHRPQSLREVDLVDVLLKRWWRTLHHVPLEKGNYSFNRILSLSADDVQTRLHRLRYLLFFLTSRGVLRSSMPVGARDDGGPCSTFAPNLPHTEDFERYEMIGDLEFKTMTSERVHALFPADEGGASLVLNEFVRVLDSNHGLLAIYDYVDINRMLSLSLANNKNKADVVEALVGELRALLWSTEVVYNTDAYPAPGNRATTVYLHSVVQHTLYELGHVVFMWRIDSTLRNAKGVLMDCLEKEFLAKRRKRHGQNAAVATEAERGPKAPRNALLPLLLLWERQPSVARTAEEFATFAMARRPARPPRVFQAQLQQLSPSPCEQSAERRRQLSVERLWSSAELMERMKTDVAAPLASERCAGASPWAEENRHGDSTVSTSPPELCAATSTAVLLPDFQPTPCAQRLPSPSSAEKRTLVRENCVVLLDPLPPPSTR
ncbi:RNA editing complex protein MP67 [Leptomonas pyrrhocoris]|uniref:RNA editing complex protein MP67 n=1 Tax=Leptomonas pyrrhocoris TaxID=157538 RepID=A0A0N0DV77_LEPPY|nr:RNA editing complex protein MP67 [Leptomonas pyrrhocoris]KPA79961.1 RNA editing complex protein MP67 [Leptomonas pyrrhocoris]|eukprot:XP_015658400.1 RNA editing complex protein MP67 [Leptomonas pyrrhocoris]